MFNIPKPNRLSPINGFPSQNYTMDALSDNDLLAFLEETGDAPAVSAAAIFQNNPNELLNYDNIVEATQDMPELYGFNQASMDAIGAQNPDDYGLYRLYRYLQQKSI